MYSYGSKSNLKSMFGYTFLDESPLGKGNFGTVYSVINEKTKMNCAAKVLSRKFISDKGLNEQMRNEMTIHKKLKHKNIVNYIDQFCTSTDIFIILEKCNSETLEKICKNYFSLFGRHMSVKLVQHFVSQISNAVYFMHSKGIAHRDLKLENIMLKFENEIPIDENNIYGFFYYNAVFLKTPEIFEELMLTSEVKIIDLGFAKELDSSGTTSSFLGTPAYLAPEVLKKKSSELTPDFSYSSKVDTWAIGVMAFHILTGDVPFTLTRNIQTFNDLYQAHKRGKYKIHGDYIITVEFMDYLNALLQFDEEERINIDDMISHPFLITKSEYQTKLYVKDLINDNTEYLTLSTNERKNYLQLEKAFGHLCGDRISKIDLSLLQNDQFIDELFDLHSKVKIQIFEREENGFMVISTKESYESKQNC